LKHNENLSIVGHFTGSSFVGPTIAYGLCQHLRPGSQFRDFGRRGS